MIRMIKTALLYLAEVYNATDQQEQGQALLESYVKENAKDSEALNTLGMMQMKDGNYEDALKYFQMGLKNKDAVNKQELMKRDCPPMSTAVILSRQKRRCKPISKNIKVTKRQSGNTHF